MAKQAPAKRTNNKNKKVRHFTHDQFVDLVAKKFAEHDPKLWSAEKLVGELIKAVVRTSGGVVGSCGGMGGSPYAKADVRNLSEEVLRRLNKRKERN